MPFAASFVRRYLTVIQNAAVAAFPLPSTAVQVTRVLPTLKRDPGRGEQVAATLPSRSSVAETLKATRIVFAPRGARISRLVAPLSFGGATSNSSPGTVNVPVHVSRPAAPVLV